MQTRPHGFHPLRAGRHARRRARSDSEIGQIKAPGFAGMLRRHPDAGRKTAAGAIAGGLVLFVAASVTAADANPARPTVSRSAASAAPTFPIPVDNYSANGGTFAGVNEVPTPEPTAVAKAAPVDPTVISGLAANGIPTVALNAYRVAAARLGN